MFFLSIFCFGVGQYRLTVKFNENNKAVLYLRLVKRNNDIMFFILLGLIIPCVFAGIREYSVGTDVNIYVTPLYHEVLHNTIKFWSRRHEIGYKLIVLILAHTTHSIGVILFSLQALVIFPLYFAIRKYNKEIPIWLGMVTYLLIHYNQSMNVMRQWIGMAFMLLAFACFINKEFKKSMIFSTIAVMFHYVVAIVIISNLFLYYILVIKNKNQTKKIIITSLIVIILLITIVMGKEYIYKTEFTYYAKYFAYITDIRFIPLQIVKRIPIVLLAAISFKDMKEKDKNSYYYIMIIIINLILSQMINSLAITRLIIFFEMYNIIYIPTMICSIKKQITKNFVYLLMIAYILFYWFYVYWHENLGETLPYVFRNML